MHLDAIYGSQCQFKVLDDFKEIPEKNHFATQLLGEDLRVDGNILELAQRKAERSFWEKDEP